MLCVERPVVSPAPPPRLGEEDSSVVASSPAAPPTAPGVPDGGVAATTPGAVKIDSASTPDDGARDQNSGRKLTRVDRVFRLQFGIEADTMTKFSRVQSIAARHAGHHVDLSELFGTLCQVYLERYDATTRAKKKRRERKKPPTHRNVTSQPESTRSKDTGRGHRAHIPESVRNDVVRRDGGRCTFVDRNGERCTETVALQVDHVRPRALGGSDETANLRAMCAAHNRLLAERTFGRKTVEGAIRNATSAGEKVERAIRNGAAVSKGESLPP
jgi:5-methylcytosine-specific restriction endonuclease McrA